MPSASKSQTFQNHGRFFPLYHFLASPITGLYFLHTVWHAVRYPSAVHWMESVYAAAIFAAVVSSRIMAVTVQNRVIRLEMRLRLREVLPSALAPRISELSVRQLIALRFAGDAEMPALVERVLAGEFAKPKEIKAAVKDWQADHLRV